MEIKDLQGKLVAVLGVGQEGRAVAEYLVKYGIKPVLFDKRRWEDRDEEDKRYLRSLGVNFVFDPDWIKEFRGFDVAFRSPGIPLSGLEPAKQFNSNLSITSQTKWFFEHCPAKIIGVTGTKGKGTTSSLIYEILRQQSKTFDLESKVYLTGNIGKRQPLEFLDDLKPEDVVIYELSSFQLQDLDRSPHIGVVLMTTQEHLDYHKDIDEYICAKEAIVKFQSAGDFAVVNADYEASKRIGGQGKGQKYHFSRKQGVDKGCFVNGGQMIVRGAAGKDFRFPLTDLQLRGEHNQENICAAALASILSGADVDVIRSVVGNFKGLEHRLEFVAEKEGIKYYNDSFSTTPETAIAAIKAFSEPLIVILGGSPKNSDFTELGQTVVKSKNIKAVILVGQEAGRIRQAMDQAGQFDGKVLQGAQNMTEVFDQVKTVARSGHVVVLSPACASFGMFKNYKDRGEQFRDSVKSL